MPILGSHLIFREITDSQISVCSTLNEENKYVIEAGCLYINFHSKVDKAVPFL